MTIGDKVGQAGSYAKDKAAAARTAASGAYQSAAQRAASARTAGVSQLDETPVLALVGGLVLGAIAAAVLPRTEREDQVLGNIGGKLTQGAKDAVQAARDAGQTKLADLGINKDSIANAAKDLAGTAAGAAKQAATGSGSQSTSTNTNQFAA